MAKTKLISIALQSMQSERNSSSSLRPGSSNTLVLSAGVSESAHQYAEIWLSSLIDLSSTESVSVVDFSLVSFQDVMTFF